MPSYQITGGNCGHLSFLVTWQTPIKPSKQMKISEVIELLEAELENNDDVELMIYNSSGDRIQPKSFSYGGMFTSEGHVDTVSFSDLE